MKKLIQLMYKASLFIMLVAVVSSCLEHDEETLTSNSFKEDINLVTPEEAYPNNTGISQVIKIDENSSFYYSKVNGNNVFEGDILITEEQLQLISENKNNSRSQATIINDFARRWAQGTMFFEIANETVRARAEDAMNQIEAVSNVRFVERTNQPDYVRFVEGAGCSSFVGRIGGAQNITLAPGCTVGNTIHEICHALGFFHEHTRPDRGDFVIINFQNIQAGFENNFQIDPLAITNGPFDFGSVMMYGPFFFSNNNQPTITTINGAIFNVQRVGLSQGDINGLLTTYPILPFQDGNEWLNGPFDYSPYGFHIGDVNNDGRDDIIGIRPNDERAVVWLSNGNGFNGGQEWLNGPFDYSPYGFHIGDVNNDGRDDIIGIQPNDERAVVWLSNGNGFNGGQEWLNGPFDYSPYGFHIGDVNNDGRDDIIGIQPNDERAVVWLSNGNGFNGGQEWLNGPFDYSPYGFHIGDVNNDGRDDIIGIQPNDERAVVWLSNGNGFNGGQEWLNGPFDYSPYGFHIGDVNNDGRDDIIGIQPNDERAVVWLSNGNGFNGGQEWLNGPFDYSPYGFHIGDVNNDDESDIIGIRPNDERVVVWLNRN